MGTRHVDTDGMGQQSADNCPDDPKRPELVSADAELWTPT